MANRHMAVVAVSGLTINMYHIVENISGLKYSKYVSLQSLSSQHQ